MSKKGIAINTEYVAETRVKYEQIRDASLKTIREIVGEAKFNPGSSQQVGKYLEDIGYILPKTATGKPDTSVKSMETIGIPFTEAILEYRGAVKVLNTYCKNYEKLASIDDQKVHPKFNVLGTVTGRTSASKQNTQNISRELKAILGTSDGFELHSCDYSAIEFRLAAWAAKEESILKRFGEDRKWDPHRYFASLFYRKPEREITEEERQIAKSANFSLMFMGTGKTLKDYAKKCGIELSVQLCDEIAKTWHKVFPGFGPYYRETAQELKKNSYVETVTGRRRNYGEFALLAPHKRNDALREAVNVKIQGLAADVALVAMAELDRQGYRIVNFVHDSFAFEFEIGTFDSNAKESVREIMIEHPIRYLKEHFGVDIDVPLEVKWD